MIHKKKFIFGPGIKKHDPNFNIQFVCSFSENLRNATKLVDSAAPGITQKIESLVKGLVVEFDSDVALKDSLQNDRRARLGRVMRQVDLRTEDEDMIFKAFVSWNYDLGMWHVMLEFPNETYWEGDQSSN